MIYSLWQLWVFVDRKEEPGTEQNCITFDSAHHGIPSH